MVAVVVEEQREREGFWQVASGFPSPFDAKCIGQTEKGFLKIPGLRERSPADPFLLLVGL
jgi:hypothetical protein